MAIKKNVTGQVDTQSSIGRLLMDGKGFRDAIHVAVLPVTADEDCISPGSRLKMVPGTTDLVICAKGIEYCDPGIGVADPFLADNVRKGQRFWMFLCPGSIKGLRHDWSHPVIDAPAMFYSESEKWLRQFACRLNMDYDDMIHEATAKTNEEHEHYITARGFDLHCADDLGDDHSMFWHHLEMLTGKTFGKAHRTNFGWSCSC